MEKFELELTEVNLKNSILEDYVDNNKKLYSLMRLINSINNNITICIDGSWGCGKTFFVNQFIYLIKHQEIYNELKMQKDICDIMNNIKENNIIIYYDAWKNDNHQDAFESIIFNILNEFPKYKNVVTDFNNIKDILIEFGKNFIYEKTKRVINFDNIKTYEDLAKQIVTVEEKKEKFKELLEKILNGKRMILIIDELDRCNPLYASKVLETIKHFYDIKNVTVIVAANNKELSNTIKKQYGNNFNGYSYLNKFYDFVITLDNSKNISYSQKVLDFQIGAYLPHNIAYKMFKKYDFSYRECNRYRTMYEMMKGYIEKDQNNIFEKYEYIIMFEVIVPIIISFKIKDINAYRECLNGGTESLRDALNYIKKDTDYKNWLKKLVENGNDGTDDEIEKILQIYLKNKKSGLYTEIFNDCIRMSI